ncbi:MAG: hypothetical protein ACIAQZ_06625 [Sedimentisphaeraceae bacterium JB056]
MSKYIFFLVLTIVIVVSVMIFNGDSVSDDDLELEVLAGILEKEESEAVLCFSEYNWNDGEKIYFDLQEKYPKCCFSPMLVPIDGAYCVTLCVPEKDYNEFSLESKRKLLNYASSFVPVAKKYPSRYLILSPTAPIFKTGIIDTWVNPMDSKSCAITVGEIEYGYYYETGTGRQIYGEYIAEKFHVTYNELKF